MDFDFRQEPSGQFDGLSVHLSDVDAGGIWQAILGAGGFDGLDGQIGELGDQVVKSGSTGVVDIEVRDADTDELISLQSGFAHVFVSLDPSLSGLNINPELGWVQITDNRPDNFGQEEMRWVELRDEDGNLLEGSLKLDWKTPEKSSDVHPSLTGPLRFSVEDTWYLRVVLFDPDGDIDENDPGLAGSPNAPDSRWLSDVVEPFLPDGVNVLATGIITLTKQAPVDEPPPPPPMPSDGDAELDPIVESVQFARDDGMIQKKSAKDILNLLADAIAAFEDGGSNVDPAGCPVLNDTITLISGLSDKRMDTDTQTDLLAQLAAAVTAKGIC